MTLIISLGAFQITYTRKTSTLSNYELSRYEWDGWCGAEKFDPRAYYVNFLLDLPMHRFEQNFSHSTINFYRLAISPFHDLKDNTLNGRW